MTESMVTESELNQGNKVLTISAPGKALIAGGYLVLERPNPGLVLATDSSFHATITTQPPHRVDSLERATVCNDDIRSFPLDVYSPQFHEIYTYCVQLNSSPTEKSISLKPRYINQSLNSYIEKTVIVTLSTIIAVTTDGKKWSSSSPIHELISLLHKSGNERALAIKLRADNDFYSIVPHLKEYKLNPISSDIHKLPSFLPCPIVEDDSTSVSDEKDKGGIKAGTAKKIVEVNKTGLGSSAALVTSLVGALLAYFDIVSIPTTKNKKEIHPDFKLVHNLAQICHSFAQGKIGSGFDVSAAVYGSHVYTRFDKSIITVVMDQLSNDLAQCHDGEKVVMSNTGRELWNCISDFQKWNAQVDPLALPPGIQVLMADICGGSESPSMAKKVLAWKKNEEVQKKVADEGEVGVKSNSISNSGATEWLELQKVNIKLKALFQKACADGITTSENETSLLDEIRRSIVDSRKYLKRMGELAGVPIEPDEQTKLADDTMSIPGVIAAGIPGAGGYDALFVLYKDNYHSSLDSTTIRDTISQFWIDWCDQRKRDGKRGIVCPLNCKCVGFGEGLKYSTLEW